MCNVCVLRIVYVLRTAHCTLHTAALYCSAPLDKLNLLIQFTHSLPPSLEEEGQQIKTKTKDKVRGSS